MVTFLGFQESGALVYAKSWLGMLEGGVVLFLFLVSRGHKQSTHPPMCTINVISHQSPFKPCGIRVQ